MKSLLNNILLFVSKFHRTRSEKVDYWKSLIKSEYTNGVWYINEEEN